MNYAPITRFDFCLDKVNDFEWACSQVASEAATMLAAN